ncbi:DUF6252 family protein [Taibaiella koreensis]|uniref:DUF6252 family protein n=1 Tax=Taibaiella koreensis TaxID=1268548 RepID=UPI000E59B5EC|nr:DUF6252 family protein [Taibaiella koreensis]
MSLKRLFHPIFLLVFLYAATLLTSCRKEEDGFTFPVVPYEPPPPPATEHDTVISVKALLNNDSFTALGRALTPSAEGLEFSFLGLDGNSLFVVLGADTPGTYEMKRSVSIHTAVYYVQQQAVQQSYTSRATAEAGGAFTVTAVDTVTHRIKGTFSLLLTSRTYPERYDFKEGVFDILYNFMEMTIDGRKMIASGQSPSNFNQGSAIAPFLDNIGFGFADGGSFIISAGAYAGLKQYNCTAVYTNGQGKKFQAGNVPMTLIRYHYGQFLQAECGPAELTAEDGTKVTLTDGSFVQGNTK